MLIAHILRPHSGRGTDILAEPFNTAGTGVHRVVRVLLGWARLASLRRDSREPALSLSKGGCPYMSILTPFLELRL